jgi:hypothetical protein
MGKKLTSLNKFRISLKGPKNPRSYKIKISQILLGLVLGCFIVLVALAFHAHYSAIIPKEQHAEKSWSNPSADRHVIKGFQYDAFNAGRRVLSIKADEFSIQKKKIGFFRFGLLNDARLKNVSIHLYGTSGQPEKRSTTREAPKTGSHSFETPPKTFNIVDILSQNPFPAFAIKRISSIELEPVEFMLHNGNAVVTKISARSATIRLRNKQVLFTGGVRLESGSRLLTTEQLILHPESATISTDSQYKLDLPGKSLVGKNLTIDIFLNLKGQQEPKLSQNQVYLLEAYGNL